MTGKKEDAESVGSPNDWLVEHGDALFAFAMIRVCQPEVAEDLVQDTLLSAIKAFDGFDGRSAVRTWLISILKRKIIDYFRHQQVREKAQKIQEEEAAQAEQHGNSPFFKRNGYWVDGFGRWPEDPSQVVENREFWLIFQNCRQKLPPLLQSVFVLREIEQQSKEEVCSQLDISPSNLSVRLFRARMNLRRCLETNWFNRK